jgi:hypothetical protein
MRHIKDEYNFGNIISCDNISHIITVLVIVRVQTVGQCEVCRTPFHYKNKTDHIDCLAQNPWTDNNLSLYQKL